jgi:hypothetical protein
MQEAVKVDKRRRENPYYSAYPKCQIGVSPELKEIIRLNEIHNNGTGKIQHYVNDTVIPCHVQIMKAYHESSGKMWTMEEITRDILRRFKTINEILN